MTSNVLTWTTERVEKLKELWAKGYSYGHIANVFGLTRNAVGGKIDRLGLGGRDRRIPLTASERNARRNAARAFKRGGACIKNGHMEIPIWRPSKPLPIQKPVEAPPLNIGLMKLKSHQCRYVTGKDGLATYCGHDVLDRSFCAQHYRLCYTKPPTRAGSKFIATWRD